MRFSAILTLEVELIEKVSEMPDLRLAGPRKILVIEL